MTEPSKMPLSMIAAALKSQAVDLESAIIEMRPRGAIWFGPHPYTSALDHCKCIRDLADELEKHCGETVEEVSSGLCSHDRDTKEAE